MLSPQRRRKRKAPDLRARVRSHLCFFIFAAAVLEAFEGLGEITSSVRFLLASVATFVATTFFVMSTVSASRFVVSSTPGDSQGIEFLWTVNRRKPCRVWFETWRVNGLPLPSLPWNAGLRIHAVLPRERCAEVPGMAKMGPW
jgi:hypothetical protein